MTLAPEIKAFLEAGAKAGLPQVWEAPLDVIRRNTQTRPALAGPAEPILEIENRFIPGPTADLPVRIYRPTNNPTAPAIVYFHGGGWVLNSGESHWCNNHQRQLSEGARTSLPIPFDDCFATLEWVLANSELLRINSQKVAVAGDSAGANLASGVALKARDQKIELAYQLLIYPCNDRNFESPSYIENATGYGLSTQAMQWFWNQYLQGESHNQNPYAIPARAHSFKDLAPAIILTAQYDPLLSDGEQYAEQLKAHGVDVRYREFQGMIHGFFTNLAVTPTAMDAIAFVAGEIKEITE